MASKTAQDLAKIVKKLGTADSLPSVPAVLREASLDVKGPNIKLVYEAEVIAFPELKLPATEAGVKKGRQSGLRNERIVARTGLTMAKVNELAEKAGVADLYLGRGRRGGSNGEGPRKPAARTSGGGTTRGTSGRRGAAAAKPAARKPAARGTRGTRGTRAAADPK